MTGTALILLLGHRNTLAGHTEAASGTDWCRKELGVGDGNTAQKEIPDLNMDMETQLYFIL